MPHSFPACDPCWSQKGETRDGGVRQDLAVRSIWLARLRPFNFLFWYVRSEGLQQTDGKRCMCSLMRRLWSLWMQLVKHQRIKILFFVLLFKWFMKRNVPISRGQTVCIIDGESRGCNSELVCWWLHRSGEDLARRMHHASRAWENWVNRMTECVWRRASSRAFQASERSEQITVIVARHRRFDLQLPSDSRAGEAGLKPGRTVPPWQEGECCFEQKYRDVEGIHRSCFVCTVLPWQSNGKWSCQVMEPDLVRVLVGLMVSVAVISAQIKMQHFYQLRAPPHQRPVNPAAPTSPPLDSSAETDSQSSMFSPTGTKLAALDQLPPASCFPFLGFTLGVDP